jgi:hypothetical protein
MQSIPLSAVLTPGAKCWGHGPPGLVGFGWPGPDVEDDPPSCAACGSGDTVVPLPGGVLFCRSCRERSHLGTLPEIYVELGGGD